MPGSVAIHEAGHAVIACILGLPTGHVTIVADEGSAGHFIIRDPYEIWEDWEARGKYRSLDSVFRGRIMALMAGGEAEAEFFGTCSEGDGNDRNWIACMLQELCQESEVERTEARLRRMTRMLMRRHRKTVQRVAEQLEVRGTLSEGEVAAFCGPATKCT
jgi:hypothetical protein